MKWFSDWVKKISKNTVYNSLTKDIIDVFRFHPMLRPLGWISVRNGSPVAIELQAKKNLIVKHYFISDSIITNRQGKDIDHKSVKNV